MCVYARSCTAVTVVDSPSLLSVRISKQALLLFSSLPVCLRSHLAMVRRCVWGLCNADERYPERINGGFFIPFPKPRTKLEKCLRWIEACGRPYSQLNVFKIDQNKYVCSKVRLTTT